MLFVTRFSVASIVRQLVEGTALPLSWLGKDGKSLNGKLYSVHSHRAGLLLLVNDNDYPGVLRRIVWKLGKAISQTVCEVMGNLAVHTIDQLAGEYRWDLSNPSRAFHAVVRTRNQLALDPHFQLVTLPPESLLPLSAL